MPFETWTGTFYSWLSLKGHLQGLHGWDRTELFANRTGDTVTATFVGPERSGTASTLPPAITPPL